MELQRMKLENIKHRLLNGEQVINRRTENHQYIVQLTDGPEISFDENYKPTVEKTIDKAMQGVVEDTIGNSTTLNSVRRRSGLGR